MRKIILFTATSLDGFIARKDGGVDWLFTDKDYGFEKFHQSIDTTLMGNTTYKAILSFGCTALFTEKNYVCSRTKQNDTDSITYIAEDIPKFVSSLAQKKGKNIWLVGGGEINTLLLRNNLIDEMVVSIHPIILGEGIPLFANCKKEKKMQLLQQHIFDNGLIQATYKILKI
jgi:dihydrofolate reductase